MIVRGAKHKEKRGKRRLDRTRNYRWELRGKKMEVRKAKNCQGRGEHVTNQNHVYRHGV